MPILLSITFTSLFFLFFGLFGPNISKRIGVLYGAILYEALSIPFLAVLSQNIPLSIAVLSFWMRGGLMNAATPLISTIQTSLISKERRGTVTSFLNLVDNLSRSFGTLIGGTIIQHMGFRQNFLITALFYVIAVIVFYFMFRKVNIRILKPEIIEESIL